MSLSSALQMASQSMGNQQRKYFILSAVMRLPQIAIG